MEWILIIFLHSASTAVVNLKVVDTFSDEIACEKAGKIIKEGISRFTTFACVPKPKK